MSKKKAGQGRQNKVVRLHGELYSRLQQQATQLGFSPGSFAGYIVAKEAEKLPFSQNKDAAYILHPLTSVYIPSHNPRPTVEERAKKIKISPGAGVFEKIACQVQVNLKHSSPVKPKDYERLMHMGEHEQKLSKEYPEFRNYKAAYTLQEKYILVSMLLFYLDDTDERK